MINWSYFVSKSLSKQCPLSAASRSSVTHTHTRLLFSPIVVARQVPRVHASSARRGNTCNIAKCRRHSREEDAVRSSLVSPRRDNGQRIRPNSRRDDNDDDDDETKNTRSVALAEFLTLSRVYSQDCARNSTSESGRSSPEIDPRRRKDTMKRDS